MHEFAYTFAYTPTLTTRRAPVYKGLSWVSALIILWSQVQVLVGPPEKQTLIRNVGGLSFERFLSNVYKHSFCSILGLCAIP